MQTLLDSRTPFGPNAFPPLFTILAAFGLLVVGAIFLFVPSMLFIAKLGGDVAAAQRLFTTTMWGVYIQGIAEIAVLVFLLLVLPKLADASLSQFGFRTPSGEVVGVALMGTVAMFVITTGLSTLLATLLHVKTKETAIQVFTNLHTMGDKAAFAFFAVLFAPFMEELVFRIFAFNAMRQWWRFWPAAIISSIIFGFAHTAGGGLGPVIAIAVPLACAGIVLCAVYARTGNAWASMITHGCFNAISLALVVVAPNLAK